MFQILRMGPRIEPQAERAGERLAELIVSSEKAVYGIGPADIVDDLYAFRCCLDVQRHFYGIRGTRYDVLENGILLSSGRSCVSYDAWSHLFCIDNIEVFGIVRTGQLDIACHYYVAKKNDLRLSRCQLLQHLPCYMPLWRHRRRSRLVRHHGVSETGAVPPEIVIRMLT